MTVTICDATPFWNVATLHFQILARPLKVVIVELTAAEAKLVQCFTVVSLLSFIVAPNLSFCFLLPGMKVYLTVTYNSIAINISFLDIGVFYSNQTFKPCLKSHRYHPA